MKNIAILLFTITMLTSCVVSTKGQDGASGKPGKNAVENNLTIKNGDKKTTTYRKQ